MDPKKWQPTPERFEMKISAAPTFAAGEPVSLTFTVTNRSDSVAAFCDYHTPFEGFRNQFLDVRDSDGDEVPYHGILARRRPPTADDFISLAPGASTSAAIDLRSAYELPPGRYQVVFPASGISGLPASPPFEFSVKP